MAHSSRYKNGNPKQASRFVCLLCLKEGIPGIQRKEQREKWHIKDLHCVFCKTITKHLEIRWKDDFAEGINRAKNCMMIYMVGENTRYFSHEMNRTNING